MNQKPTKVCETCGRSFEWRKKWALNWELIKFCSDQCRNLNKKIIQQFGNQILDILIQRGSSSSICPSEILPSNLKQDKSAMENVRRAARQLAHKGVIEITQKNQVVDPDDFRGPIRLRIKKV